MTTGAVLSVRVPALAAGGWPKANPLDVTDLLRDGLPSPSRRPLPAQGSHQSR